MAIDKIFKSSNVDDLADNILSEVDDFMVSVDQMQQRKVAGNVQKVIQAFKQIETDLHDRYDNVTDVLEKRVLTIKDGRDGSNGSDGRNGRDGKPGRDGVNGKQGPPGTPGKDGTDGIDGVSVTNANIDFDGSLVISLSSGQQINVGEVVPPELERQLVELRQGGGSAGSSGDVMGPTSSTDNAIARFDGTTGKLVQNSVVTIADTTGNMAGVGSLAVGTTLGVTGVSTLTAGAVIQGMTVGLGSGSVATNTAVGFRALLDNSSGTFNSALGYEALRYTTTGYSNTATGNAALHENISGYGNTASGSSALYYNTLGDSNVATGASSLQFNISGSSNTVSGAAAMQSNATGSRNTAIGALALITYTPPIVSAGAFVIATSYTILTVGTTNFVAIGASANTVGVVFTATGAGSGTGTASTNVDATNTAIGYGAGSTITTGTKNTIIGAYSGNQGSLDIRTASNYVVLSDGDGNPRAYWNGANATFNGGLAVTGTLSASGATTIGARLQVTAAGSPPASGSGLEVLGGATPLLFAYNRTGSAYLPLNFDASAHGFSVAGTNIATVSSTGLAVTGTLSATGVATFSAGTAALPAITTTGDTNTGIFFPAADTIAFTEGGAEAMRIDSAGNVGIGITSILSTSRISAANAVATASQVEIKLADTTNSSYVQMMRTGATYSYAGIAGNEAALYSTNALNLVADGANVIKFSTNTTERARIDSSGNFLVTGAGGLGYGTGSGGAVTQATSRTTGVTLDKTNGAITLVSAAGLATFQSFTVTNSKVAATDVVHVTQKSGTDLYQIFVTATAAGSFRISYATTGGVTTEQPVFNFAVIKAVTA